MDLAQITEMKNKIVEELRQIDRLKQSMQSTLAGLIEWEKYLQSSGPGPVRTGTRRAAVIQEVQPKPPAPLKTTRVNPSERVGKALANMHGEFTRSQLLAEAEGDGKGELGTGTFGSIFSKLLKKQRIQCVKGTPGQRDSLYLKSSESVLQK
jgi:hypothetical protein